MASDGDIIPFLQRNDLCVRARGPMYVGMSCPDTIRHMPGFTVSKIVHAVHVTALVTAGCGVWHFSSMYVHSEEAVGFCEMPYIVSQGFGKPPGVGVE